VSRGLPAFGEPGTNTICVVVCGRVNRPGYYHLPTGSLVQAGIDAAQGLKGSPSGFKSKVLRCGADGSSETLRFPWAIGVVVPELPLKEGDIIYLGKESYP
jgi:protein involved in polysaccharide export with SLBB domain